MPSIKKFNNANFVSKLHADLYFEIKKIDKINLINMFALSEKYGIDIEYIYCLIKDIYTYNFEFYNID